MLLLLTGAVLAFLLAWLWVKAHTQSGHAFAPPATVAYAAPFTRVVAQQTVTVEGDQVTVKRRCLGKTLKGEQCKRNAAEGSAFCYQHQPRTEPSELPK